MPKPKIGVDIDFIKLVANLKDTDGLGWNKNLVDRIFPEETARYILNMVWPNFHCDDKLLWCGDKFGRFLVHSSYLVNTVQQEKDGLDLWVHLWQLHIHDHLKLFIWRVLARALPIRDTLVRRFGIGESYCASCGEASETLFHLFKECHATRSFDFASKWGFSFDKWTVSNLVELIQNCNLL